MRIFLNQSTVLFHHNDMAFKVSTTQHTLRNCPTASCSGLMLCIVFDLGVYAWIMTNHVSSSRYQSCSIVVSTLYVYTNYAVVVNKLWDDQKTNKQKPSSLKIAIITFPWRTAKHVSLSGVSGRMFSQRKWQTNNNNQKSQTLLLCMSLRLGNV